MKRILTICLACLLVSATSYAVENRVGENSTTTGTGTMSLSGAKSGYVAFADVYTSPATVTYLIESSTGREWEIGSGTWTDGTPDTLARTTVEASSNGGSKVNFSAGTKSVYNIVSAAEYNAFGSGGTDDQTASTVAVTTTNFDGLFSNNASHDTAQELFDILDDNAGGVSDGDRGDVVISESGNVYTVESVTGAAKDNPYAYFNELDGTDLWFGLNDADNSIEVRSSETPGASVLFKVDEDGDIHASGDIYNSAGLVSGTGGGGSTASMVVSQTIMAPAAGNFLLWKAPADVFLTGAHYRCAGGTSWTGQLQIADSNGDSGANTQTADTTSSAGTSVDVATFDFGTVDSGDYVICKTTSVSGSPTSLFVQFEYSEDPDLLFFYADADADTYGDAATSVEAAAQPEGYVSDNTDCDDTDPDVNPGATEICGNSIDDDCVDGDEMCSTYTFNSADKNADISLSNYDKTATSGTSGNVSRAVRGFVIPDGKYYFEYVLTEQGTTFKTITGVSLSTTSLSGSPSGYWGYGNGHLFNNGGYVSTGTTLTGSDRLCIAIDTTADKIWFGKNGTWFLSGNPATGANPNYTGVSGSIYPFAYFGENGEVTTIHTEAKNLLYSIPSGFSAME